MINYHWLILIPPDILILHKPLLKVSNQRLAFYKFLVKDYTYTLIK